MTHLTALALTLLGFVLLAAVCFGWGRLTRWALGLAPGPRNEPLLELWLGWAVLLAILQFLHLWFPLRAAVVVPLAAVGLGGFFWRRRGIVGRGPWQWGRATLVGVGAWCVAAVWVAARAMQTPLEFDGALYHFHTIKWLNEAPITPGLGNLHGRLAFNSAFYPFVAALNLEPLGGHGRSLANGFLLLAVLAQILHRLQAAAGVRGAWSAQGGLAYLGDLLALPAVVYVGLSTLGLASPSADTASTLVQFAVFLPLVHGIGEWRAGEREQTTRVAVLALLAVTLATVKMSSGGFVVGVLAIGIAYVVRVRPQVATVRKTALLAVAMVAVWTGRGYLLSGYPVYPVTLGRIDFDWAVPQADAQRDADNIYSWARQPWADAKDVLGNHRWIGPWFWRMRQTTETVAAPVCVALAALVAAAGVYGWRRKNRVRGGEIAWLPLGPVVAGLGFWWLMAPDPRFANALFWLLPITALLGLVATAERGGIERIPAVGWLGLALLANLHLGIWVARNARTLGDISFGGWKPILPAAYTDRVTESGLVVHTFRYDPQELIWDGPRPATPDFNPKLRLRDPQRPAAGFTVRP